MATPEQTSVRVRGMDFGLLAWGEPTAPLALLVHGYPDTAWTWRHLGPHLAGRGWRAVAPFTRGYAPTDLAPDDRYRVSDQVADLLALHERLGGDGRAALVGHDWGAVATWQVTSQEPDRFGSYVAMSVPPPAAVAGPLRSVRTLPVAARQLAMSWYFLLNLLPGSERTLARVIPRLWRDWSPGYDASEDLGFVFESLADPGRRRAALRYYRNTLQRGIGELVAMQPAAPVLYLHGSEDGCAQSELGELHAANLPAGSRFEAVPGVGHFLHLEDPERVNSMVAGWIGPRA